MKRRDEASHLPVAPNQNGSRKDHVMATKALPSQEVIRQLFRYEPTTGKLFRLAIEMHGEFATINFKDIVQ